MNTARVAVIVAVFALVMGIAGAAAGGYCVLQNRELATQLGATQDSVQTLAATNQDLSDQLAKLSPGRGGAIAGPARGAAGNTKIDPELANEIRGIEARLTDLDGGPQSHFGLKSDVSQLKLDLSRLDSKVDDLARRH